MGIHIFKNWWLVTIKGLIISVFGIVCLLSPVDMAELTTVYYGVLIIILGVTVLVLGRNILLNKRWLYVEGLLDILIGCMLIFFPLAMVENLALIFGIWLVLKSCFQFAMYKSLMNDTQNRMGIYLLNGIITMILAIGIIINPLMGVFILGYILGFTALCYGIFIILTSLKWRKLEASTRALDDAQYQNDNLKNKK